MIKRITISVEEDSGSTMQHTVSTREEALALIDRYFPKVKIGDKVRILTDGGYTGGEEHIGEIHEVIEVLQNGGVGIHCQMEGDWRYWAYLPSEYELVKE